MDFGTIANVDTQTAELREAVRVREQLKADLAAAETRLAAAEAAYPALELRYDAALARQHAVSTAIDAAEDELAALVAEHDILTASGDLSSAAAKIGAKLAALRLAGPALDKALRNAGYRKTEVWSTVAQGRADVASLGERSEANRSRIGDFGYFAQASVGGLGAIPEAARQAWRELVGANE